jgi:hypothetical protein
MDPAFGSTTYSSVLADVGIIIFRVIGLGEGDIPYIYLAVGDREKVKLSL